MCHAHTERTETPGVHLTTDYKSGDRHVVPETSKDFGLGLDNLDWGTLSRKRIPIESRGTHSGFVSSLGDDVLLRYYRV